MKCLVIFFLVAQISRTKSENELNNLESDSISSKESSEPESNSISKSSEEGPGNEIFLRPPNCGISNATRNRINGGKLATQHQFPWNAALGYIMPSSAIVWGCGGALITEKHVLTVAHCIHQQEKYLKLVRLGTLDIFNNDTYKRNDPGQDILIDKKIFHEKFKYGMLIHDIGMVILKRKIIAPMVWPICLPVSRRLSRKKYVGKTVTVAGWGVKYQNGPRNPLLEYITLKVVPKEKCIEQFENLKPGDNVMCAGDPQWKQSLCRGDSGSPVMYQVTKKRTIYYAVGLVSFGPLHCGTTGKYEGLTPIILYLDWIRNQISKK